jgi:hypothetical protein
VSDRHGSRNAANSASLAIRVTITPVEPLRSLMSQHNVCGRHYSNKRTMMGSQNAASMRRPRSLVRAAVPCHYGNSRGRTLPAAAARLWRCKCGLHSVTTEVDCFDNSSKFSSLGSGAIQSEWPSRARLNKFRRSVSVQACGLHAADHRSFKQGAVENCADSLFHWSCEASDGSHTANACGAPASAAGVYKKTWIPDIQVAVGA